MCELLSLEEILREGVIPPEQQGGGQLQEAATTGQTQVGQAELLAQKRHILGQEIHSWGKGGNKQTFT